MRPEITRDTSHHEAVQERSPSMVERRKFTAEFKARVVLEVLRGAKSSAEACRQYDLKPPVLSVWKATFLANADQVFQSDARLRAAQERIAELERLVGQQTLELEVARQGSHCLPASTAHERVP
jgi:transposase-like protein